MISRYNKIQTVKAIFFTIGGLFCCWLAYLFFRYVPVFIGYQVDYMLPIPLAVGIGLFGLAVSCFSSYRLWKARGGSYSYHESGLYLDLVDDTAGACIVDLYAHRITGPAYLLGQIFMAGPQFILRAWTLLCSRIVRSDELESSLKNTLIEMRAANKWQGLHDYPKSRSEILYLAQMDLIDFSGRNGVPRFKAR